MSLLRDELLRRNVEFAETFGEPGLQAAPARRLAVVTCMDARIEPLRLLGLRLGDAHVVRNAGAVVTDDVVRSLVISHWELGAQEAFVIGHTQCGMTSFTNETLNRKLGSAGATDAVDFMPFRNVEENVRAGVQRLVESPLLPAAYLVHGFVYDVAEGRLHEID